jgi:hypothetical protein
VIIAAKAAFVGWSEWLEPTLTGAVNTPHFTPPVVLLPIRMAIRPVPLVAFLTRVTWAAVRVDVRLAAPVLDVLIAGSLKSVLRALLQVPFERVTGRYLEARSFASFRAIEPVPFV